MNTSKLLTSLALATALSAADAQIDTRPVPAQPQPTALPANWQHGA
ncbi:MAG: hypothetical protein JF591_19525, partial [Lysobacter sp.]|nr:hypothetical protein [Lysobacter sp.]